MTSTATEFSWLEAFTDFYQEVLNQERWIESGVPGGGTTGAVAAGSSQTGSPQNGNTKSPAASPAPHQRLLNLLRDQAAAAQQAQGNTGQSPPSPTDSGAQYLMAAFADERFLNQGWPGQAAWAERPLEMELFGTHRAATEVFARLDQILQGAERAEPELLQIYLLVLTLGFEGRYSGDGEETHLEAYRAELYQRLYNKEPETVRQTMHVAPEAYAHVREGGQVVKIPPIAPWAGLLLLVLLLWGVLSVPVWRSAVGDFQALVERALLLL